MKTLLPFLKNITEESDLENFQDFIVALDACYWLHKAISISMSRFGDDRRCDPADFKRRFPASQKILCTVQFVCIFLSQSEIDLQFIPAWICLTKKNSSISCVCIFDGLYYRARRSSASKQQGEKSSLITILFSSTSFYYFANSARL